MDLSFLKMLKSMAKLEQDPNFQTETLDYTNLNLKHPENVVVVVSATSFNAPPQTFFERRMETLSRALLYTFAKAWEGMLNFSIVVHEGMYIDIAMPASYFHVPDGFSLEIVGVKDVRIVFEERFLFLDFSGNMNLTLRNVFVYDRREKPLQSTIIAQPGVKLTLIDVKINSPRSRAVISQGARVVLSRCSLRRCYREFGAMQGGLIVLNHCFVVESGMSLTNASSLTVSETRFERCSAIVFHDNGHGYFENCVFEGGNSQPTPEIVEEFSDEDEEDFLSEDKHAMDIFGGSKVVIKGTSFNDYIRVIGIENSCSKVTAANCSFTETKLAIMAKLNASATIIDCQLRCDVILAMSDIIKGSFEFRRNDFRNGPRRVPVICNDNHSVDPIHDFERVDMIKFVPKRSPHANSKERSEYTQKINEELLSNETDKFDFNDKKKSVLYKACAKCFLGENVVEGGEKFKFCVRCRKVCYCSKKCQKGDWPDHKLICQKI